jgi:type I restriction-modification system DNA methylase subunit
MKTENHSQTAAFLWSIADLLRGDFKQSQYGRIILPFTLLRRMECVLETTKKKVLAEAKAHQAKPDAVREKLLLRAADQQFYRKAAVKPRAFRPGISGERFADCLPNKTGNGSAWELGRHEKKSQSAIFLI